jgi:hypothetical protein
MQRQTGDSNPSTPIQTQPQQGYQALYTQHTPPPPTKSKKTKKNLIIALVCVILVVSVAILSFLLGATDNSKEKNDIPTITYDEFVNDVESDEEKHTVTFKSFDIGDVFYVIGTVRDARLAEVPSDNNDIDPGTYTVIYFENPYDIQWDHFAYKGNLKSYYTIGEEGKVRIHIERVTVKLNSHTYYSEYPSEFLYSSGLEEYIEYPTAIIQFTETSPGNYSGYVTSVSDIIRLRDVLIEIWDMNAYYGYGDDDRDLTDDDPEEVYTEDGEAYLEFRDINDNDLLDQGDTLMFYYAEPGDIIHIYDTVSWRFIADFTVP